MSGKLVFCGSEFITWLLAELWFDWVEWLLLPHSSTNALCWRFLEMDVEFSLQPPWTSIAASCHEIQRHPYTHEHTASTAFPGAQRRPAGEHYRGRKHKPRPTATKPAAAPSSTDRPGNSRLPWLPWLQQLVQWVETSMG